jgi:hypothetical protein
MIFNQPLPPAVIVDLHGLKLAFQSPDQPLCDRFETVYGHLPHLEGVEADIFVGWYIHHHQPMAPEPLPDMPALATSDLVSYYGKEELISVRFPKYGLITIDLGNNRLVGGVTRKCLEVYGVFEDVMMITLAPLYRRRGWFPLHAFAGYSPDGKVALLTGQIGAGKTTTGLALLNAGWKLLSNDSPLLTLWDDQVQVLAYPGRLSAYDDALARFEHLKHFIPPLAAEASGLSGFNTPLLPQKRVFRVEEAFPDPWAMMGEAGGLFFPKVVAGLKHSQLVDLPPKQALLELMPQAIESWDKEAIGQTLQLLRRLVEQVPSFILELAPDIERLPELIKGGMR